MDKPDMLKMYQEEQYANYLYDIELANEALSEVLLNVSEKEIICDIYALPSHNHQTFYTKLYKTDKGYVILYAKPILHSVLDEEDIFMYRFRDSVESGKANILRGRIVCGIKYLDKAFVDVLLAKLEYLPEKHILDGSNFILDGVFQAVRVFEGGIIKKEVVYEDAEEIPLGEMENLTEIKSFYSELYLKIEKIIGCGDQ
ncbi:MAG: hypothetical protein IKK33_09250 [Lachnospiraceae bacterium]|nr:hypothetical protein [Lachnospiraceae bacterium]